MMDGPDVDVLMKGAMESREFLKELAPAAVAGGGKILSCLTAYEVPDHDRFIFVTDGGINICPTLEEKIAILENSIAFLYSVGLMMPKAAVLSVNEKVSPRMPVTVEAKQIADMFRLGRLTGAQVEGPMALDVALSKEAARHKGIKSPVASNADLILVPNIEVGNIIDQTIIHFAGGKGLRWSWAQKSRWFWPPEGKNRLTGCVHWHWPVIPRREGKAARPVISGAEQPALSAAWQSTRNFNDHA